MKLINWDDVCRELIKRREELITHENPRENSLRFWMSKNASAQVWSYQKVKNKFDYFILPLAKHECFQVELDGKQKHTK